MTSDFKNGLAEGTRAGYASAVTRLARFGLHLGIVRNGWLLPPSELDLMFWCSHMAHVEHLSPGYISQLLSGVQNAFLEWGLPSPLKDHLGQPLPSLHRVLRGIKRMMTKPRRVRLAVTTVVLKKLMARLTNGRPGRLGTNYLCYRAMLSLGVYGLLRQGEMTSTSTKSWNPLRQAASSAITFERDDDGILASMVFHCVSSKCDPFRETVDIVVHATGTEDCPVQANFEYAASRPRPKGPTPLFQHTDGTYVTRSRLSACLRQILSECGYKQNQFSTHSLRIGGCCSLAAAGYGREVIAIYGRWKSNALLLYLKLGRATLRDASVGMASINEGDIETRGKRGLRRN